MPSGKEWSFGSSDARMVGGTLDPGSEERDKLIQGYPRFWNGSDDVTRLGAEGQTRDEALANFVDLLNLLEDPAR